MIADRINRANVNGQDDVRRSLLELREAIQAEAPCKISAFCLWGAADVPAGERATATNGHLLRRL